MKTQTILGTMLVGFGAALVGVAFAPVVKRAVVSPHQRIELAPYQPDSYQLQSDRPYQLQSDRPYQPQPDRPYQPQRYAEQLVSRRAAAQAPPLSQHVSPVVQASGVSPIDAPILDIRAAESISVQPSERPLAERDPVELPSLEMSSPQQLPSIELPDLEAPIVNWGDELPQEEYSEVSVADIADQDRRISPDPLPARHVPPQRIVARDESTREPAPAAKANVPLAQASDGLTRAIRIKNAGYERRGRQQVEQMSFEAAANRVPEMRSIREPRQNQVATRPQSAGGRQLHPSELKRLRVSPQIETRVAEHLKYGESLTRRQSFLAAREEFTLALLLIAGSHKTAMNSQAYLDPFLQAITALDEVSDFVELRRGGLGGSALAQKIMSHKTRLLSPDEAQTVSPIGALDLYCGFAQSRIEKAIGYSVGGSQALHALGKLETLSPQSDSRANWSSQARALVLFRAAMSVNPNNAVCSNDLGVLLYDLGRLRESEEAFKQSLGKSQSKLGWENLARVHQQMAVATNAEERNRQAWLASLASQEAEKFTGVPVATQAGTEWATAVEFENRAAFPVPVSGASAGEARPANQVQRRRSTASALLEKVKGLY